MSCPIKKYLIGLLLLPIVVFSQFYETGQEPASVRWKQINTPSYQIIFAQENEIEAQKLANILNYVYAKLEKTIAHQSKKVSILLHSRSVKSNGVVVWAPRRIEIFTLPPRDIYPQPWLEQLALHEMRHVIQLDKLDQGLTHLLGYLLGEQAVGGISGIMPLWFYEGDAVCTETALSLYGRGRQPSFEMELRALAIDKNTSYKYDKATFGSYKNFVPDHYRYGYLLTAYGRCHYDSLLWSDMLSFVARNPYMIATSYFGFKKLTGLSKRKYYNKAMSSIRDQWKNSATNYIMRVDSVWPVPEKKQYTSYLLAQPVNDSLLLAEKSTLSRIKQFVLITKNGTEKILHIPGRYSSGQLSHSNSKIVWSEEIPDKRWQHRSYYEVKSMNLLSGKRESLTKKSRLFAPVLSPSADTVVAVQMDIKNQCSLVFIDVRTKKITDTIAVPGNAFVQTPSWSNNGQFIYAVMLGNKGKALVSYHAKTKKWDTLINFSYADIRFPVQHQELIFYVADYSGIDNVFALNPLSGDTLQVTYSKFGVYPFIAFANRHVLIYSDYTSDGFVIKHCSISTLDHQKIPKTNRTGSGFAEKLASQEKFVLFSDSITQKKYETTRYNKFDHLLKIHSWSPFYFNYQSFEFNESSPSVGGSLLSQNLLGTMVASFSYQYFRGINHYRPVVTYKGWYPIIEWSADIQPHAAVPGYPGYFNNENSHTVRTYVPFNISRNRFQSALTPELSWSQLSTTGFYYTSRINSDQQNTIKYGTTYSVYERMAHRDILPRMGFVLDADISRSIFSNNRNGLIGAVSLTGFLPSVFPHHVLKLKAGIQKNFMSSYLSLLSSPRGYGYRIYAGRYRIYSAEYVFPLLYPDVNIGSFFYFKRIRSALIYQYAQIENGFILSNGSTLRSDPELSSAGIELTTDMHGFQIPLPINTGIRYTWFKKTQIGFTEFLLSFQINP